MNKAVLCCATDAGGARVIAPITKAFLKRNVDCIVIVSDVTKGLFNDQKLAVLNCHNIEEHDISNLLKKIMPSTVICGTTRYVSLDRRLIPVAKAFGIRTIVILDEWFNYSKRFQDDEGALAFLPDYILCQDDRAKQGAIDEGIPEDICEVTGDPAFSDMMNTIESKTDITLLSEHIQDIMRRGNVITYVSEAHTLDCAIVDKVKHSPLKEHLGYTEHSVRADLLSVLKELGISCAVIEKLHPADMHSYELIDDLMITWITVKDEPLLPLIKQSRVVVGMRSIALLEAALVGARVISYQPNLRGDNVCTAVRLGLAVQADTISDLRKGISEVLMRNEGATEACRTLPFIRKDCIDRILEIAL